jgi:hypothetical protein
MTHYNGSESLNNISKSQLKSAGSCAIERDGNPHRCAEWWGWRDDEANGSAAYQEKER